MVIVTLIFSALCSQSPLAKKHLIEILTGVCIYSRESYTSLLDAFQHNKKAWVYPSRFSVILAEFDEADTVGYRTTQMGFINALVGACSDVRERNGLRNELISLQLLDILHQLKREDKDAELTLQIQVRIYHFTLIKK